jgi:type IV pilus assembly protein PilQ
MTRLRVLIAMSFFFMTPMAFGQSQPGDQDGQLPEEKQASGEEVIDEFGTFEIAVEDVPLPQVLNMLAIQSRRNIITSKRVGSVSVTANLFDVTFYEALESILHIASLCYDEQGNFICVMTCEEKLQRENANRVMEDRVFYLDHISPADAEALAKPLLSDNGNMSRLGEVQLGFAPGKTDAGGDSWAHEPVLVVRDYKDNLKAIETLLEDVDTPPKQVMVESTILVTEASGDYAWGMDVSVLLKGSFTDLINPLNPVSWLQNQNNPTPGGPVPTSNDLAIQSTVGATTERGGFKLGVLNENVGVFMRLLDEVSDTMILARPKILALNRQRAQVLVGERVAYLSPTQTETASTQSVQYLDTGINLILRPFISRDGSIRLELFPSVSEYTIRKIGNPLSPGYTEVPDESTHEITTNVRVRDGETIVLGGLFKDKAVTNRRSVPGLGDVPILGAAFQGQDDEVTRQEIIFLVTPTVIKEEVMTAASDEADNLVRNVQVGVREGLLPWSREKIASNLNHDAHVALGNGETNRAISYINRSLRNDPNQPEMVNMRYQLLGERSIYSENGDVLTSIFDRMIRNSIDSDEDDQPLTHSDPLSFVMPDRDVETDVAETTAGSSDEDGLPVVMHSSSTNTEPMIDPVSESAKAAEAPVVAEALAESSDVVETDDVSPDANESTAVVVAEETKDVDILNLFTETRYRTKLTDWWISLLAEDIRIQTEMATAEVE